MAIKKIYQFHSELEDFKPKIWRRFQIADDITIAELGYIVMTMYEMMASHLLAIEHERPFLTPSGRLSKRMELICRYDIPDDFGDWKDDWRGEDATKIKLSELQFEPTSRLLVWYDFGDDWHVILKIEQVFEGDELPDYEFPRVLAGKGFGIVEDCGGIWGLSDLVEAFKAKEGEAYKQFSEWLGVEDFDITAFDINDMNFRLTKIPQIYKKIYEDKISPTKKSIELIERKYLKK